MDTPTPRQGADRPGPDSAFEPSTLDGQRGTRPRPASGTWLGPPQRRSLALVVMLSILGLLLLARHLAATPWLDAQWRSDEQGTVVLNTSPLPALAALAGETLRQVAGINGTPLLPDALLLHPLPRWQVADAARQAQLQQRRQLADLLQQGSLQLSFADGSTAQLATAPRGWAGLGVAFYALCTGALALLGLGTAVLLQRPQARNGLYLLLCACQAGQLVLLAAALHGLGSAVQGAWAGLWLPLALDAATAAAAVHAMLLHPRRHQHAALLAPVVWLLAGGWCALVWRNPPAGLWWWAQGVALASVCAGWWLLGQSRRDEPNPFAVLIQRSTLLVGSGLLLVTASVALASRWPDTDAPAATLGAWAWCLVPSALLLLAPFVSRSRQVLRDAALVAGATTIATAAHLLLMAGLSLGWASSWALAVGLGVAVYAAARRWAASHAARPQQLGAERTFEQLYRAARDVQIQPGRYGQLLGRLLQDLFEPREVLPAQRELSQARVLGGGAALEVPLRGSSRRAPGQAAPTLVLRFAMGGQRLFTDDDARLADRLVEQLRRAVAYDRAVERGRSEERQRIAQDLHDDIGARLLTLMYQAQTPAMEEYIRLTLKDLKTLTRGLAAGDHRLTHAAGEWKADLAQRLAAAQVQLVWSFSHDRDVPLSMVQWSALTRVLRELVSNALQHARAASVSVHISLEGPVLLLRVADDGRGRAPQAWAHGLGLGGVRKRVKLIGGDVAWHENLPQGIVCEVRVSDFGPPG
jgi:signal transduction histidine kinase